MHENHFHHDFIELIWEGFLHIYSWFFVGFFFSAILLFIQNCKYYFFLQNYIGMQNSQEFFLRCGTEKLNWKQEIDTKYDNIFVNHENFFFFF